MNRDVSSQISRHVTCRLEPSLEKPCPSLFTRCAKLALLRDRQPIHCFQPHSTVVGCISKKEIVPHPRTTTLSAFPIGQPCNRDLDEERDILELHRQGTVPSRVHVVSINPPAFLIPCLRFKLSIAEVPHSQHYDLYR